MSKTEILDVLKRMLAEYENFANDDFRCHFGFCFWIYVSLNDDEARDQKLEVIIDELYKDIDRSEPFYHYLYWYPVYDIIPDPAISIRPRIDHLKRTIARLQSEQNESNP